MNGFQKWFRRLPVSFRRHKLLGLLIKIFPSLRYSELRFNGASILIADLADNWAKQFFREGEFEPEFFEIVSPLIPKGGVFFDVGANFGWCSFGLFGARPADQIRFFLFEANPSLVKCIEQSAALNKAGDFQITHGCVFNKSGFSSFEFSTVHTGGSHYSGPSSKGIPNIVLDEFIAEHRISRVDLMKMDIEGSEPLALEGARQALSKGIIQSVYIEVFPKILERQGRRPIEVISLLRECGFNLFWCRSLDFEVFPELKQRSIKIKSDRGCLTVAPLETFPEDYKTDILALHSDTVLLAKLLDCQQNSSAAIGTGTPEVVV